MGQPTLPNLFSRLTWRLFMYGLLNQALKEVVLSQAGERVWSDICVTVDVSAEDFEFLVPYDDVVTYRLVEAASETLGVSGNEILQMLGRHWVTFTAQQGYGEMMTLFGRDLRTCLKNLNRMHGHMGAMMPDLHPPRFIVEDRGPDNLTLHYHSNREGLAPVVAGILEGLAEKFKEKIQITHISKEHRSGHDEFEIQFLSA
jgi:hypothetical protein